MQTKHGNEDMQYITYYRGYITKYYYNRK